MDFKAEMFIHKACAYLTWQDKVRCHWTHTVTGEGSERDCEFEYRWVSQLAECNFVQELDDYLHPIEATLVSEQN